MGKATKIILIVLIVVVAAIAGSSYFFSQRAKKSSFDFVTAERTNLTQEVSVTGKVKPAESVDLAFEKSGRVSSVYVEVGDKVESGKILIKLEGAELETQLVEAEAQVESSEAQLTQYQAALEAEEAQLAELKQGTREEEIQVAQTKVDNAQKALLDAEINLENVQNKATVDLANLYDEISDILDDAYAKADNAVNTQTEALFSNDISDNPELTFSTTNSQAEIDSKWQRVVARDILFQFKTEVDNLPSQNTGLDMSLIQAEGHLTTIRSFLNRVNDALNASTGLSQSTLNTYKGYVDTGRDNVNTALANINGQKQDIAAQKALNQQNVSNAQAAINSAQNTLDTALRELALKKAGATEEQIAAQEAEVARAEANIVTQEAKIKEAQAKVENIQAQLSKTALRSPISGIITEQKAKRGEIVSAQTAVVTLISEAEFEIEANMPEVDIAKIQIGNPATVTLDAYGEEVVFEAQVTTIDPAATMVEGIATYKTTLQFTGKDARIKSGMTANVDILTARREGVIAIPSRAVISKNGVKTVRVAQPGSNDSAAFKEVVVETGLKGSDGNVEITKGISEGDKIITSLNNKNR